MARKKEKEFNAATAGVEELTQHLEKSSESLFKLRFRAATAPLKNPMEIRSLRREIARLNTFINQRKAEEAQSAAAGSAKTANGRKSR